MSSFTTIELDKNMKISKPSRVVTNPAIWIGGACGIYIVDIAKGRELAQAILEACELKEKDNAARAVEEKG